MWFRTTRSNPVELVIYGKPGCHLCEEMMSVVERVVRRDRGVAATVREVDISRDPELAAVYGEQIPVLFVNGRKAFKYRLTERALRARLNKEKASGEAPPVATHRDGDKVSPGDQSD